MDTSTLLITDASLMAFLGAMLLFIRLSDRESAHDKSAYWLAAAHLTACAGVLAIFFRYSLPVIGLVIAHFFIMSAAVFFHRALVCISGAPKNYVAPLLLLAVVASLWVGYYTYYVPDIRVRAQVDSIVLAIITGGTAIHLWRYKQPSMARATHVVALLLLLMCLNNTIRASLIRSPRIPLEWMLWTSSMAVVGLTIGYLWMHSMKSSAVLQLQALTDPLTGLLNRRAIAAEVQRELCRRQHRDAPISALMIDLNRFKQLNDSYGHATGDRALCAVARALENSVRGEDIVSRISGDEFAVILPETGSLVTEQIALRIGRAIDAIRLEHGRGNPIRISCSIGTTTLKVGDATLFDLLGRSDKALYMAKLDAPKRNEAAIQHA